MKAVTSLSHQHSAFRAGAIALAAAAAVVIGARSAAAQSWCDHAPGSYVQCALWIDGDYLRQGDHGERLAMADRFTPLPLRRFVAGDSAIEYARRYERDASRDGRLQFVGAAMMLAASVTGLAQRHQTGPVARASRVVLLTGMTIHLAGIPFRRRAEEEGQRAVWWNNAALSAKP